MNYSVPRNLTVYYYGNRKAFLEKFSGFFGSMENFVILYGLVSICLWNKDLCLPQEVWYHKAMI